MCLIGSFGVLASFRSAQRVIPPLRIRLPASHPRSREYLQDASRNPFSRCGKPFKFSRLRYGHLFQSTFLKIFVVSSYVRRYYTNVREASLEGRGVLSGGRGIRDGMLGVATGKWGTDSGPVMWLAAGKWGTDEVRVGVFRGGKR